MPLNSVLSRPEMNPRLRKRPRFGDVVKITASAGHAIAQYTHKHEEFGALVRVFEKPKGRKGLEASEIAGLPVQFSTFFPLGAACNRGIAEIIGNAPVRSELEAFPVFRFARTFDPSKTTDRWWLWDGEKDWFVGSLTKAQRELPLQAIMNDTFLVQRAVEGWRSRDDPR